MSGPMGNQVIASSAGSAPSSRSAGQVASHLLEVVDVAEYVILAVLDRERPVLLRSRGHHHSTVALVEPAQIGPLLVDLEVVAIMPDPLRPVGHAAAGRDRDHMEGQAVACD